MKSKQLHHYFKTLNQQRDEFYYDDNIDFKNAWVRPTPKKWSIVETVYHLVLMVRLFRRFSKVYIPVMLPLAHLRKKKPYKTETTNIYQDYSNKKKRPMSAPFLINPPSSLKEKWTFSEIQAALDLETEKLMTSLNDIEQDLAGQIYYPDPIAKYPNLIQSVHLLAIHEQHHYDIVKNYYTS